MSDFYVYAWRRPDTESIFYIGKGSGKRDRSTHKRNPIFNRIVAKLKRMNLEPSVYRLQDSLSEVSAFALERAEIARHGRIDNWTGTLANLTDGGEGPSGYVQGVDTRRMRSASMTGVRKTDEHRANISAGIRGIKKSPIAIEKVAASNRGRKRPKEILDKMSAAQSGKTLTVEHRVKIADAHRLSAPTMNNSTGFKGVSYERERGKYRALIRPNGKLLRLGRFSSAEDAARAYDKAALAAWGDNCFLNFPMMK